MCARICQRDTDGDRVHRARIHSGRRGLDTRSAYFRDGVDDCRLRMLRAVCHRAYGRRRCGSDMLRGDSGFRYEEKKELLISDWKLADYYLDEDYYIINMISCVLQKT